MMEPRKDVRRGETSAMDPSATDPSPMDLADIVAALWPSAAAGPTPTSLQQKARAQPISAVCIDSREATPNSLFVALPGERTDGHAYVSAAFAQGAVAALVKRPVPEAATVIDTVRGQAPKHWSPPVAIVVPDTLEALQQVARHRRASRTASDLVVIGVTGSVGKTTAKEAIAAVVAQHAPTLKSAGNHNNEIGLPLTLCALRPEHRYAVLEMGMYALGEIALLCDIARPNIGVVMNVQPVHLERLGTMERIAQAKAELIDALPPGGLAVLNGDDPRVRAMAARTPAPAITFGLGETNTVRARDTVGHGLEGIEFVAEVKVEALADGAMAPLGLVRSSARLHCPTPGRHSVWPALAAVAVGAALGLSWDEIQEGLTTQAQGSAGLRLVPRPGIGGITVLDDTYNSSPASALAALDLLADMGGDGPVAKQRRGRLMAVLGDMLELGSLEREGHRQVGVRAADVVDILLTVGPRARYIAEAAQEAGMAPEAVHILEDNETALRLLRALVREGDVVLIKGSRSMAMEQIVGPLTREE